MSDETNGKEMTSTYTPPFDPISAVEAGKETCRKFLSTAGVQDVFGEPVTYGDMVIIPTAEVLRILGFGFGSGSNREGDDDEDGGGGGGGGGGRTLSRPVAVVVASPKGVRVEPVIDPTKIALAAITAWGFIVAMVLRFIKDKEGLKRLKQ
jgi:uncharacterized spore protein YtfJ